MARRLTWFLQGKATESIATPPGWDASPSQGYPQQYVAGTHFIHLGGERQCRVKFLVKGNSMMEGSGSRATNLQF